MRFVGLLDGEQGAYGVVFPDCPGCTAMGATEDEAVANAVDALSEWIADSGQPAAPRSIGALRDDPEVQAALGEGAAFVSVPFIRNASKPVRANISITEGVLEAIDAAASAAGVTRSAFLADAAMEKIRGS